MAVPRTISADAREKNRAPGVRIYLFELYHKREQNARGFPVFDAFLSAESAKGRMFSFCDRCI